MKLLTILLKNFRLLFRSKSSAFAVVIGPLLIIALIMMAFSGTDDYTISVGVVGAGQEGLSADFVEQLETDQYEVITYYSLAQCIEDVKMSTINLCLNFPENFESDEPTVTIEEVITEPVNGTNETNSTTIATISNTKSVEFYVDQSRINIVESIIFALSSNIDATSEDITLSKTLNVLNSMNNSAEEILEKQGSSSTAIADTVKPGIEIITENSEDISSENVNSETIDADLIDDADTDASTAETSYIALYTKVDDLMDAIGDCSAQPFVDECEDLDDILSTKNTEITSAINSLQSVLSSLETDIENANENLEASDEALERIRTASQEVEDEIAAINTEINNIDQNLAVIKEEAENIQSLSAQDIENPFEITVNEIVSASNRSQFMFPYYLMVLILFVGMMLSSNLIVMEKESLAFFRNFCTPTSEISHLVARFITNFIVLAVQVSVVLTAVYFLLDIPVMANYSVTLTILAIS
ncbi:MAG: ABC transporter permease, partial [Nanoarchaeota archaeon]|nr:ABC transporter permease [Nanoarchaeota archaeon]